jgi:hypothetical protein
MYNEFGLGEERELALPMPIRITHFAILFVSSKMLVKPFFAKPYVSRCFGYFRNIFKIITKKFGGLEICCIFV